MLKSKSLNVRKSILTCAVAAIISSQAYAIQSKVMDFAPVYEVPYSFVKVDEAEWPSSMIDDKKLVVNNHILDIDAFMHINARAEKLENADIAWQNVLNQIQFAKDNAVPLIEITLPDITRSSVRRIADALNGYEGYVMFSYSLYTEHMADIDYFKPEGYGGTSTNWKDMVLVPTDKGGVIQVPRYPQMGDDLVKAFYEATGSLMDHLASTGLNQKVIGLKPEFLYAHVWEFPMITDAHNIVHTHHDFIPTVHRSPDVYFYRDQSQPEQFVQGRWYLKSGIGGNIVPETHEMTSSYTSNVLAMDTVASLNDNHVYYRLYRSHQIAGLINSVAGFIKEHSDRNLLVGTDYGQFNRFEKTAGSQMLAIDALLNQGDVDLFFTDVLTDADKGRKIGSTPVTGFPLATFERYPDKLAVLSDNSRPSWEVDALSYAQNQTDWIQQLQHNLSIAASRSALYQMDDISNKGWFIYSDESRKHIDPLAYESVIKFSKELKGADKETNSRLDPEVILIVDDVSMAANQLNGFGTGQGDIMGGEISSNWIRGLGDAGVAFKQYRLRDLLDGQVDIANAKLFIFENLHIMDESTRMAIESLKKDGNTLLFANYSALFDESMFNDPDRVKEVTGFDLTIDRQDNISDKYRVYPYLNPLLDEGHEPVIKSMTKDQADIILKRFDDWNSMYALMPRTDKAAIERILQESGVQRQVKGGQITLSESGVANIYTHAPNAVVYLGRPANVYSLNGVTVCSDCQRLELKNDAAGELFTFKIEPTGAELDPLPKGLFHHPDELTMTYIGFGNQSYCTLNDRGHMTRNGFTEVDLKSSPAAAPQDGHENLGMCDNFEEIEMPPLPQGLFRQGTKTYFSEGDARYCRVEGSQGVFELGFDEHDVVMSKQVVDLDGYTYLGKCSEVKDATVETESNLKEMVPGLFRVGDKPFYATSKSTFCTIRDAEHLLSMGLTASDYAKAPQADPELSLISQGECD
jgi:hypothetical protein